MSIYQTIASDGAGPTWRQLGDTDYEAIGLAVVVDVAAALLVAHVMCEASWPAYAGTIPQLVVFSSLAAIVATIGVSMRYGMWGAVGEEVGCNTAVWVSWLGLGALFSTGLLRVFRYHDVLVKHSSTMSPVVCQLLGLMLPCTMAPALLASPGMETFDLVSMECPSASLMPEYLGFAIFATLAVCALALTFRLRVARVQAPDEFATAAGISVTLALASVTLPWVHLKTEAGQEGRREGMLALTALASLSVVATPVLRYVKGYVVDEGTLKNSGDFNFGKWRSKEEVAYRLMLHRKFREAARIPAGRRDIQEFPAIAEFFRVLKARDDIESYPLLQASTMRILDTYYRVGAPGAVAIPISDACRSATLTFRASSAYIFDRARREMLQLMGIEVEPLVSGTLEGPKKVPPQIKRSDSAATSSASSGISHVRKNSPRAAAAAAGVASIYEDVSLESPRTEGVLTPGTTPEHPGGWLHQPPTGLSPVRVPPSVPSPPVPSPLNPNYKRRSSAVSAGDHHNPNTPLSAPLDYRGVDSEKKNNKKNVNTRSGGGGRDGGASVVNPIASLLGKLGGGGRGRGVEKSRRQRPRGQGGDTSDESSPSTARVADGHDTDSGNNRARLSANQGGGGMVMTTEEEELGRARRGSQGIGHLKAAGVEDVHAAFGLDKSNDDEDETSEYHFAGFFRGMKKKKQRKQQSSAFSGYSGISGYGNMNMLDSPSSSDGGTDLVDAARAIQRPLYGDTSRVVGRQNFRTGDAGVGRRSHRAASTLSVTRPAHNTNISAAAAASSTTTINATIVHGHSLELSDALGLDLEQEGGSIAAGETKHEGEGEEEEEGGGEEKEEPAKTDDIVASPLASVATIVTSTTPSATDTTNGGGGGGGGGGGLVLQMARRFEAEERTKAFGPVLPADDNEDMDGPPPGSEGGRDVKPLAADAIAEEEEEENQDNIADCV